MSSAPMIAICCRNVVRRVSSAAKMYAMPIRCSTPANRKCCARYSTRCQNVGSELPAILPHQKNGKARIGIAGDPPPPEEREGVEQQADEDDHQSAAEDFLRIFRREVRRHDDDEE